MQKAPGGVAKSGACDNFAKVDFGVRTCARGRARLNLVKSKPRITLFLPLRIRRAEDVLDMDMRDAAHHMRYT